MIRTVALAIVATGIFLLAGCATETPKTTAGYQQEKSGVQGKVLAVNRSYGFVVLSLGAHNGIAVNSTLVVKRGTTAIAKVKVSSVEPSTCVADILSSSTEKSLAILPGDRVIYSGS